MSDFDQDDNGSMDNQDAPRGRKAGYVTDERLSYMEQLAARQEAAAEEDAAALREELASKGLRMPGEDFDEPEGQVEQQGEDEEAKAAAAAELAEQEAAAAEAARVEAASAPDLMKQKIKAKIGDREEEIEIEQLLRTYQKSGYADRQLEEANKARREAEQYRSEALDLREKAVRELESGRAPVVKLAEPLPSGEAFRKAMESSYTEEPEQAAIAMHAAVQAESSRIANEIVERRLAEEATKQREQIRAELQAKSVEDRWTNAILDAQAKNPNLVSDPDIQAIWERNLRAGSEAGLSPAAAVELAAERVNTLFGFNKAAVVEPVANKTPGFVVNKDELLKTEAQKEEAKRFAVAGKTPPRVEAAKQVEKEESPSDIVAEMRRQREAKKMGPRAYS